jgi:hypothetical protein
MLFFFILEDVNLSTIYSYSFYKKPKKEASIVPVSTNGASLILDTMAIFQGGRSM